jgi:hypothetical protein
MKSKKEIECEIEKVKSEIAMSNMNDGWWNGYMTEKLDKLKKLLEENEDDNNNLLNT